MKTTPIEEQGVQALSDVITATQQTLELIDPFAEEEAVPNRKEDKL